MKNHNKCHPLVPALIAGLGLILTNPATAQTFKTLYNFTALVDDSATSGATNSDGSIPQAGMVLSGNTLYGTAEFGGPNGSGTVFAVNIINMSLTNLYSFPVYDASAENTSGDSANPNGGLVLSGNTLYGTTYSGGALFAVNTDGTSFTNLTVFTNGSSQAGLIISGNTLYGTAFNGGHSSIYNGTVFEIDTNSTGFMYLYGFSQAPFGSATNRDGIEPTGPLVLSGNTLYGMTQLGGTHGDGTVFAVNIIDMSFTNLHNFTAGGATNNLGQYTNSDGFTPNAGLVLSGNTLYGMAPYGGTNGYGTVFALNTDGTGFTNLHNFSTLVRNDPGEDFTNSDGANPAGGLTLSGNFLYGAAQYGGSSGRGTVFALNTDGTGFTNLYNFSPLVPNDLVEDVTNNDGAYPAGGLTLSGITLYGATQYGGANGFGTVFNLTFPPQLSIIRSGTNMIVSWPTNAAGFSYIGYTLQSATNLSPAVWNTNLPAPVVISGQNTVTNPISGTQQFFRLVNP